MFVATQSDPGTTILLIPGVYAFTALSSICSVRVRRIFRPCCRVPTAQAENQGNDDNPSAPNGCWKKRKRQMVMVLDSEPVKSIGFFLQIFGLLAAVIALFAHPLRNHLEVYKYSIYVLVSIPVCGIVLSFLWSSMVQSAIFKSEQQQHADREQEREGQSAYPGSYKGGTNRLSAEYMLFVALAFPVE